MWCGMLRIWIFSQKRLENVITPIYLASCYAFKLHGVISFTTVQRVLISRSIIVVVAVLTGPQTECFDVWFELFSLATCIWILPQFDFCFIYTLRTGAQFCQVEKSKGTRTFKDYVHFWIIIKILPHHLANDLAITSCSTIHSKMEWIVSESKDWRGKVLKAPYLKIKTTTMQDQFTSEYFTQVERNSTAM